MELRPTMRLETRVALFALCCAMAHGCDCGGTPPGTGDAAGSDAWVGNRPPELAAYASITLLPGDTVSLVSAPVSDPDGDTLTCSWTADGLPAGVSVPTACAAPTVAVDR